MTHLSRHPKDEPFSWRRVRTALIFLAALSLWASALWAQNNLAVTIATDREGYTVGEEVKVTFTLDNESGRPIHLEGSTCAPIFNLIAFDADGQEIWRTRDCPSCCCTCCQCPIEIEKRNVPPGITEYPDAAVWNQVRIVDQGPCGCETAQVGPLYFYLVGQVGDVQSDPVIVQIR